MLNSLADCHCVDVSSDFLMFLSLFMGTLIRGAIFRLMRLFRTVRTFRVLKQFRLIDLLTTRYNLQTHICLQWNAIIDIYLLQGWFSCKVNAPSTICAGIVDLYIRDGWNAAVPLWLHDSRTLYGNNLHLNRSVSWIWFLPFLILFNILGFGFAGTQQHCLQVPKVLQQYAWWWRKCKMCLHWGPGKPYLRMFIPMLAISNIFVFHKIVSIHWIRSSYKETPAICK